VLDRIFLFLGCDAPVDWLIGLGQLENGKDSPVSPLMPPIELYVSQDLLNHGCICGISIPRKPKPKPPQTYLLKLLADVAFCCRLWVISSLYTAVYYIFCNTGEIEGFLPGNFMTRLCISVAEDH